MPKLKKRGELDSQQIEILGRSLLKAALIEGGIEVATPERDNGIDLIAYRTGSRVFLARPIQMKAATAFTVSINRKYVAIPNLILAFVMGVRGGQHSIFAMTYPELVMVAKTLKWTSTDSWINGGAYTRTRTSVRIVAALEKFRMTPVAWGRFWKE